MTKELEYNNLYLKRRELEKKIVECIASVNPVEGDRLTERLDSLSANSKLKIAFVGQHNSGKSTIISALTGRRDISISTNVETDFPSTYQWEGVEVIDTPGLYAGVKEKHDKDSLKAIKESDLLVYCITSSLFDDLLTEKFAELAYEKSYRSKIFLVINKMFQECGEFDELVGSYRESINESLLPFGGDIDDFQTSFFDARDYVDGVDMSNEDIIVGSRFSGFITLLNSFVADKKLMARLDTPCRELENAIETEIGSTATELDHDMLSLLGHCESCLIRHKSKALAKVFTAKQLLTAGIMNEAASLSSKIGQVDLSEEDCDELNSKISSIVSNHVKQLSSQMDAVVQLTKAEMGEIWDSPLADAVSTKVNEPSCSINSDVLKTFSDFNSLYGTSAKVIEKAAGGVIKMANGGAKAAASGSKLHKVVLEVGHFFGKSFKPWEAVGIVSKMSKIAKALGPWMAAIGVLIDIVDAFQAEKRKQEIYKLKRTVFEDYSKIADDVCGSVDKECESFVSSFFDDQLEEVQRTKQQILDQNKDNNEYVARLKSYHDEVRALINEISNNNNI